MSTCVVVHRSTCRCRPVVSRDVDVHDEVRDVTVVTPSFNVLNYRLLISV